MFSLSIIKSINFKYVSGMLLSSFLLELTILFNSLIFLTFKKENKFFVVLSVSFIMSL